MADFEGLIRQALKRQDDSDPAIRDKVYQSSRRALAKMIAGAGVQPPEIINRQRQALEDAIERIEADYRRAAGEGRPEPAAAPPPPRPPEPQAPPPRVEPVAERQAGAHEIPSPQPHEYYDRQLDPSVPIGPETGPGVNIGHDVDHIPFDAGADEEHFAETVTASRRFIAIAALVGILVVIGWLVYFLVAIVFGDSQPGTGEVPAPSSQAEPATPGATAEQDAASVITLLSASDTSALDTAGRGSARIVTHGNLELIELTSLRPDEARNQPAEPILLQIRKGVIPQIAGKQVTVEILAKSGSSGPSTFSVGCEFAGTEICGRKRFRVGIQPEAFPFEIEVSRDLAEDDEAYLTISTDVIASTASQTGKGEPIDIAYVRLRVPR